MVEAKPAKELIELRETPAIVPAHPLKIVVEAKIAARAAVRMGYSTFYRLNRSTHSPELWGPVSTPHRLKGTATLMPHSTSKKKLNQHFD
jgi:hypothetical protein